MEDKLLDVKEACELLNISRTALYRLKKEGLPYIKLGGSIRFDKKDLMKWVEESKISDK